MPIVSIPEPIQHHRPQVGSRAELLRERKDGFIPWAPIGGSRNPSCTRPAMLGSRSETSNVSVVQLALAWLLQKSPVMLPIPGTSSLAHPRREHGCRKTPTQPGRVEEDRRFGEEELRRDCRAIFWPQRRDSTIAFCALHEPRTG